MNVLEEANKYVTVDRKESYGKPKNNMEHIAEISSAILKHKFPQGFTAKDIVMIMFATKLSREMHQTKRDNHVDLAGYSLVLSEVCSDG